MPATTPHPVKTKRPGTFRNRAVWKQDMSLFQNGQVPSRAPVLTLVGLPNVSAANWNMGFTSKFLVLQIINYSSKNSKRNFKVAEDGGIEPR